MPLNRLAILLVLGACGGNGGKEHEVSFNLDMADVQPLLSQFAAKMDGFGDAEIATIVRGARAMKIDATREWKYTVRHGGAETGVRIEIYLDDVDAPEMALWIGSKELATELNAIMIGYMEAQGR